MARQNAKPSAGTVSAPSVPTVEKLSGTPVFDPRPASEDAGAAQENGAGGGSAASTSQETSSPVLEAVASSLRDAGGEQLVTGLAWQGMTKDQFTTAFPKLTALAEQWRGEDPPSSLKITAHAEIRRAGIRHPLGEAEYPGERFSPPELEAMLNEPALSLELI